MIGRAVAGWWQVDSKAFCRPIRFGYEHDTVTETV